MLIILKHYQPKVYPLIEWTKMNYLLLQRILNTSTLYPFVLPIEH